MESGDILTVVGGLVLVLVIALVANPQHLTGLSVQVVPTTTIIPHGLGPNTSGVATTQGTLSTELNPNQSGFVTPQTITTPTAVPTGAALYQIFYTNKPFTYPRFKLPENMVIFGASDILANRQDMVPFAFIEYNRSGGLTQIFSVPYPVWVLNTTVTANLTPQYGDFRMVLCYASNGSIINGEEILNRGSSYRIIQVSNTDVYMIISTAYIDRYRITLETARNYYDAYKPA